MAITQHANKTNSANSLAKRKYILYWLGPVLLSSLWAKSFSTVRPMDSKYSGA